MHLDLLILFASEKTLDLLSIKLMVLSFDGIILSANDGIILSAVLNLHGLSPNFWNVRGYKDDI